MVKRFVVDSSVIVKWLNTTNEEFIEIANSLLSDALHNTIELLAPELSKYEIGNVLLKRKQLVPKEADISIHTIYSLPITFVSESEALAKETFLLAHQHNITYYDASFLSLARQYDATLVTENIKHQGKTKTIQVCALQDYKN